ncbi:MAG: metallophosphoesterase [Planctomycetes bacterium]|nr:metallophosphoesterase [Planctomycetota bacterium]
MVSVENERQASCGTVRLAHLSDIHVSAPRLGWQRADWFNKRLAAWFNFRCLGRRFRFRHGEEVLGILVEDLRTRGIDHVIFSGDATALGFEEELRRAVEELRVGDVAGGLAVPGNHDYCTVPAAASGIFERYFAPWQRGERIDGAIYPFAQKVGHAWLVAVNSCTGNRWAWDAGGSVGREQLARLERLLAELTPGPRILVTHYPVCLANGKPERRTHGLRDLDDVVRIAAAGGVKLWLHGHRHGPYCIDKPTLAPFPVVCAGSATQTGCWSYSEYTLDGNAIAILRRTFDPESRSFQDVAETRLMM